MIANELTSLVEPCCRRWIWRNENLRLLCFDEKSAACRRLRARPALLCFDGKLWRQISNFHLATAFSHRALVFRYWVYHRNLHISNHIMLYKQRFLQPVKILKRTSNFTCLSKKIKQLRKQQPYLKDSLPNRQPNHYLAKSTPLTPIVTPRGHPPFKTST